MKNLGHDHRGLGLLGQYITKLIASGGLEDKDVIYNKMVDGNLVSYLVEKYSILSLIRQYDIDVLNKFFEEWSPYAEKFYSPDLDTNTGLLMVLFVIFSQFELHITQWS